MEDIKEEDIEPKGYCSSCKFTSHDGDYGEIQCCDSENSDDLPDGAGDTKECPEWKPLATLEFCKKHNHWHYSTWHGSCKYCYEELMRG